MRGPRRDRPASGRNVSVGSRALRLADLVRERTLDGAIATTSIMLYVFLLAPIAVVVLYSFNSSETGFVWTGFSTSWYVRLFHDAGMRHGLRVSFVVGITTAFISTVFGTMASYAMARRTFRGRNAFNALVLMPLVVPEIVLAVALLVFFVRVGGSLGYFSLIAGHLLVVLPYSTLILLAAVSGIDQALEEAAADLGANSWGVFRYVILPLLIPGMATSFALAFLFSFDDIVMSTFVSGVGTTTLPMLVYSMLRQGVSPEVNALGTLLIAATLVVLLTTGVRQATVAMKKGGGQPFA
ncbi:MAG: ABC transporter permease [Thermoleophilia bacterium]